jgi:hypothetical protein
VDAVDDVDKLRPRGRGVDVDLDDAGVGGDDEPDQAGVHGREVALEDDGQAELGGAGLDDREQVNRVLEVLHRREEHPDVPVSGLDAQGGERHLLRLLVLVGGRCRLALAPAGRQGLAGGQLGSLGEGRQLGLRRLRPPGEGVEGQARAHRRVAGDEDQVTAS